MLEKRALPFKNNSHTKVYIKHDFKEANVENPRTDRQNAYGTSKDHIIAAAEKLFAQQGFKSTTLKDVAKLSGANTALVGYHFGNKEGLRKAVIEKQLAMVQAILDTVISSDTDLTAQSFKEMTDKLLKVAREQEVYYRTCVWSLVDGGEYADFTAEYFITPLLERISGIMQKINPQLHNEEALSRAILYIGTINQYSQMHWHYSNHLKIKEDLLKVREKYDRTVLNILLQMIN